VRHLQMEVGLSRMAAKLACVTQFQKFITATPRRLIPVESAFGGMGLYRLAATRDCRYVGIMGDCTCHDVVAFSTPCTIETCEHVAFHRDMIEKHGAKLFICSTLIVKTQQEHL
jgi:hypothetical protein